MQRKKYYYIIYLILFLANKKIYIAKKNPINLWWFSIFNLVLSFNLMLLFVAALLLLQGSVCCNIRALFIVLMQISHQYYKLGLVHSGCCVTLLFVLMHFIRCCLELKD